MYYLNNLVRRILCVIFAMTLLASCSIVRGYMADGAYGPMSFSYEKRLKDTIVNRSEVFTFEHASQQASWIDTLHFFNQGKMYSNTTMWEAIGPKTETQGVLIVQKDSIVYEKCTGDITSDKIASVFSVSKSITSLLCGIAVDEGYIKSIDDPVTDYLRLHAMAKLNYGRNIMGQVKKLEFRCEPGTEYRYESMTTEILGIIIERATRRKFADYLEEKVWSPLGMESQAYMNYDSKKHHTAHAFGGLAMTMLDLAKIGRLYLNKGKWNGKRIVSESWIEQSTLYSRDNEGYHFCWYNTSCIGADKPEYPGYYALGIRGQVLYVNPYKQLIMVRLGLKDDTYAHIPYLFEQLSNLWPK